MLFGVVVGYTLLAFVTAYASEALVFDVHEEFIARCARLNCLPASWQDRACAFAFLFAVIIQSCMLPEPWPSCVNRIMWQRRKEYLAASVLNSTARIFLCKSKGGNDLERLHNALERAMLKHRWHASKVTPSYVCNEEPVLCVFDESPICSCSSVLFTIGHCLLG